MITVGCCGCPLLLLLLLLLLIPVITADAKRGWAVAVEGMLMGMVLALDTALINTVCGLVGCIGSGGCWCCCLRAACVTVTTDGCIIVVAAVVTLFANRLLIKLDWAVAAALAAVVLIGDADVTGKGAGLDIIGTGARTIGGCVFRCCWCIATCSFATCCITEATATAADGGGLVVVIDVVPEEDTNTCCWAGTGVVGWVFFNRK